MNKCAYRFLGTAVLMAFAVTAFSQSTTPSDRVVGIVTSIDAATNQIMVKADTGETKAVVITATSALLRMPPGETSSQKASKISLEGVAVGDRLFARGAFIGDGKTLDARQVVVSSAAAATTTQAQTQPTDARKRPMMGRIARVDAGKNEITLQPRGREGVTPPTIVVTEATRFFRYAPDSMDINHASRSSLTLMREGDQLRAIGERSEDGTRFTATEIIAGSMTRTAGEVVSVDAARKELTLKNNEGQTITVVVGDRSSLRRVTPEVAATFATRPRGDGQQRRANDQGERRERRERPAGENGEAGRGGEGRAGRGGRGFQQILEGLPAISLSELKKGDAVFVTGSEGTDRSRMTAIMLITGDAAFMQRFQRGPNRGPQNPGLPGQVIGGGVGPAEPQPNNP